MRDDDIRALFHHTGERPGDGPPLGIAARDVITRGRRVRARRKGIAVAGSTLAVVAAVVVSLSVGGETRSPDVVRPADPPTVAPTTPDTTAPPPATTPGPSAPQSGSIPAPPPATTSPR